MTMTWMDTSEVVCGLILKQRFTVSAVSPEMFFGEYGNLIKLIKSGITEPEELIKRVGLNTFNACLDAEKRANVGEVDWAFMLEKSAKEYSAGIELEKISRKLQHGDEIDQEKLKEISEQLTEKQDEAKPERSLIRDISFIRSEHSPIPYLVETMFQEGSVSVFAGDGGAGKTYLMLCMAASVSSGVDFLGLSTKQSPVFFIDEETNEESIAIRWNRVLNGMEIEGNPPIFYRSQHGYNFLDEESLQELERNILTTETKFIVIDALSDTMPGGDENSSRDMTKLFLGLRKVAANRECAIVLIHHLNKSGGYRGSSDIKAKCDNLWIIDRKDDNSITIKPEKVREGVPKSIYATMYFEGEKVWVERSEMLIKGKSKLTPAVEEVYNIILLNKDGITREEIESKVVICGTGSVKTNLSKLGQLNLICRPEGDGGKGALATYIPAIAEEETNEPMTEDEWKNAYDN